MKTKQIREIQKPSFKVMPKASKCFCGNCEFCHSIRKKLPENFEKWTKSFWKIWKSQKSRFVKKSIEFLKKMNEPHKAALYISNADKYIIELKNVEKWYYNNVSQSFQQILFAINLRIKEGEFVVIVGESGSGKTTLLNILSGLERASNGSVIVANHNLISFSESRLIKFRKKFLSIIFQNYSLMPELNIWENVNFVSDLQEDARKRIDADYLIDYLNISPQKYKFPQQLSGGQQQRAAIAKSLSKNPKILFADEPTGAVDAKTCQNILEIFWDINQKYKTTVVMITHNQSIAKIAHKVIRLESGKISEVITQKPTPISQIDWKH